MALAHACIATATRRVTLRQHVSAPAGATITHDRERPQKHSLTDKLRRALNQQASVVQAVHLLELFWSTKQFEPSELKQQVNYMRLHLSTYLATNLLLFFF
jgi:hypothetical protein